MYWKLEALSPTGNEVTRSIDGSYEDVKNYCKDFRLEIISVNPDLRTTIEKIVNRKSLSSSMLAIFFIDFSRMQKCGLSASETIASLIETSSNVVLRDALIKISASITDGRSLKEAFENTKVFPKIVPISLNAAEKTGNIAEISEVLGNYFKFNNDNNKRLIGSLVSPIAVFCALTALSVVITIKLVPQLNSFLSDDQANSFSTKLIVGYAHFMQSYWWIGALVPVALIVLIKYTWSKHKEFYLEHIYNIPVIGSLIKETELTGIFLSLYVYQKSGVNIIETINNINLVQKTYITEKLLLVRDRINAGMSLGEAFKRDKFFPAFIHQNLTKGAANGNVVLYLGETYKYFDMRSKELINSTISIINPALMGFAFAFLGFIVLTFYVPIYTNMGKMGNGIY